MARNLKLKMFAALLLRAMARDQTEKGTERVVPRYPNVARRLGLEPDRPELATVERYLDNEGYIRSSGSDHESASFTVAGVGWEELGYQATAEGRRRKPYWKKMLGNLGVEGKASPGGGPQEGAQGPRWRRMLGR